MCQMHACVTFNWNPHANYRTHFPKPLELIANSRPIACIICMAALRALKVIVQDSQTGGCTCIRMACRSYTRGTLHSSPVARHVIPRTQAAPSCSILIQDFWMRGAISLLHPLHAFIEHCGVMRSSRLDILGKLMCRQNFLQSFQLHQSQNLYLVTADRLLKSCAQMYSLVFAFSTLVTVGSSWLGSIIVQSWSPRKSVRKISRKNRFKGEQKITQL